MNSISNSAKHSALLAAGQVCRARAHARAQACRTRAQRFVEHPGLVCRSQQETLCRNTFLQTLSQHKIFCGNRNGPALGKLCRDTRGSLSRPKHPIPALNPITTQNFCRDTGLKIFVATENTSIATQTSHYAWEPCCDMEIFITT